MCRNSFSISTSLPICQGILWAPDSKTNPFFVGQKVFTQFHNLGKIGIKCKMTEASEFFAILSSSTTCDLIRS